MKLLQLIFTFLTLGLVFAGSCLSFPQACGLFDSQFASVTSYEGSDHHITLKAGENHYFQLAGPVVENGKIFKVCGIKGSPLVIVSNKGDDPDDNSIRSVEISGCQDVSLKKEEVVGKISCLIKNTGQNDIVYTLVSVTMKDPITLSVDNPIRDQMSKGGWKKYSYTVEDASKDISIQLTVEEGNMILGTSKSDPEIFDLYQKTATGTSNIITYSHLELDSGDTIFIGATSPSVPSFYHISVIEDSRASLLTSVPSHFKFDANQKRYFKWNIAKVDDIRINVALQFGVADMYVVSNKPGGDLLPSKERNQWKIEDMQRHHQISINSDNVPAVGGNFNILVQCSSDCEGNIFVSYTSDAILLDESQTVEMTQQANEWAYFKFFYRNVDTSVELMVFPYEGSNSVYIACEFNPDKKIPSKSHFYWGSENKEFHSISFKTGSHAKCPDDVYYVAITSDGASTYAIGYMEETSPMYLSNGEPVILSISPKETQTFVYEHDDQETIDIWVETFDGNNVEVFGKSGVLPPTGESDADFTLSSDGLEHIAIDEKNAVSLLVKSKTMASVAHYELVCSSGDPIELITGYPFGGDVNAKGYFYYTLEVKEDTPRLSFTANSFYGNGVMYISNVVTRPTRSGYLKPHKPNTYWASESLYNHWNFDKVVIENAKKGVYYIGVTADTECGFQIRADIGKDSIPPIVLNSVMGIQLDENNPVEYMKIYVDLIRNQGDLLFSLVNLDGSFNLKKCTDEKSCKDAIQRKTPDWSSKKAIFGQKIFLSKDELKDVETILVSITGSSRPGGYFGVSNSNTPFTLPLDMNYGFSIPVGSSDIIQAWLPLDQGNAVNISTFSMEGEFATSAYWEGQQGGPIVWDGKNNPGSITITKGVRVLSLNITNTGDSVVDALVAFEMGQKSVISLLKGVPFTDYLDVNSMRYFKVDVPKDSFESDFEISFTDLGGMLGIFDIYASINEQPGDDCDYSHRHDDTRDHLLIDHNDDNWKKKCSNGCTVYINSVARKGERIAYEVLTNSISDNIVLETGASITEWASVNESRYFEFEVTKPENKVTIEVVPVDGDPDVCISTTDAHPKIPDCLFYSRVMSETSPEVISFTPQPFSDTESSRMYYISVSLNPKAKAPVTEFMINFDIEGGQRTILDGQPVDGEVENGKWEYFKLQPSECYPNPIRMALRTPHGGHVKAYVSAGFPHHDLPIPHMKDGIVVDYYWLMDSQSVVPRLRIESDDTHYTIDTYIIGVYGVECDGECQFSLDVTIAEPQLLLPGISHTYIQTNDEILKFRVDVDNPRADVLLTIEPLSPGDFDAVVSKTSEESGQITTLTRAERIMTFSATELSPVPTFEKPGVLYVIMKPQSASLKYSITQQRRNNYETPKMLSTRETISDCTEKGGINYYRIYFTNSMVKKEMNLEFFSVSGGSVVYFNPAYVGSGDYLPPSLQYHTRSHDFWSESTHFTFKFVPGDSDYFEGYMDIAVKSLAGDKTCFEITTDSHDFIEMPIGEYVRGEVFSNMHTKYSLTPLKSDSTVTFMLTVLQGHMKMYVGLNNKISATGNYIWARLDSGVLVTDPKKCADTECTYYIYLECLKMEGDDSDPECLFNLVGSENSSDAVEVYAAEPVIGVIAKEGYVHYILHTESLDQSVELYLSMDSGEATLLAGTDTTNFPTVDNPKSYKWKSGMMHPIVIEPPLESKEFAISVYGITDAQYYFVASLSKSVVSLSGGHMTTTSVSFSQNKHFSFDYKVGSDITVFIERISGSVELYATFRVPTAGKAPPSPQCTISDDIKTCTDYEFSILPSSTGNYAPLTIQHKNPCALAKDSECNPDDFKNGKLYIGVFGTNEGENQFGIVASNSGDWMSLSQGVQDAAITTPSVLCKRDTTGACISDVESRQIAYFSTYLVESGKSTDILQLSFERTCSDDTKTCVPLNVFITSCFDDICDVSTMYPSQYSKQATEKLWDQHLTSLEIAITKDSPAYCDVTKGECNYYISVMSQDTTENVYQFNILASTRSSVEVIPSPGDVRDIIVLPEQDLSKDNFADYVYSDLSNELVKIKLERCYGDPTVYICDGQDCNEYDDVSASNYHYFINKEMACTNPATSAQDTCVDFKDHDYSLLITPRREYVDYNMRVLSPSNSDSQFRLSLAVFDRAFWLVPFHKDITVEKFTETSMSIAINEMELMTHAISSDGRHGVSIADNEIHYYAHIWSAEDETKHHEVGNACGIHYMEYDSSVRMSRVWFQPDPFGKAEINFGSEFENQRVGINIVAVYSGDLGRAQEAVYNPKYLDLKPKVASNNKIVLYIVAIVLVIVVGAFAFFWLKKRQENNRARNFGMEIGELDGSFHNLDSGFNMMNDQRVS
eukprot:TRINITY_DN673067_c0_g1_i1.p1 TRINITY_DN673067_c0_g1~~TRINITY_DN673067_c0_g1_i1.p1  ORF type:complete len:2354 (+),score=533.83 TRINITY_DN673067_c0_g1_i1:211-7272(+)